MLNTFPEFGLVTKQKKAGYSFMLRLRQYILHVSYVAMGAGKSCLKMKTRHTAFIFDKEQNIKNGKEN